MAKIRTLLKAHRYHFTPVRSVSIPQATAPAGPRGVPAGENKLGQDVVRTLRERIYAPVLSASSQGFRPQRSCHTALRQRQRTWAGGVWVVALDLQSFYDRSAHEVLLTLRERTIADGRFSKRSQTLLQAGDVEDGVYPRT
jgi:retron-type reverse transcriptase